MALYRCGNSGGGNLKGISSIGHVDLIASKATGSVNVASLYPDLYTKLTIDNFFIVPDNASKSATSTTGQFAVWRNMPTSYKSTDVLTKSYNSSTGVLTFELSIYARSIIDCTGHCASADASATLIVPCDIYIYHNDIKSKTLYKIGTTYGSSATINLSTIDGYKAIWSTDILVALKSCNVSGSHTGTNYGHQSDYDSDRTATTTVTVSYQTTTSYKRDTGTLSFSVALSGDTNTSNTLVTEVYIIQ